MPEFSDLTNLLVIVFIVGFSDLFGTFRRRAPDRTFTGTSAATTAPPPTQPPAPE